MIFMAKTSASSSVVNVTVQIREPSRAETKFNTARNQNTKMSILKKIFIKSTVMFIDTKNLPPSNNLKPLSELYRVGIAVFRL